MSRNANYPYGASYGEPSTSRYPMQQTSHPEPSFDPTDYYTEYGDQASYPPPQPQHYNDAYSMDRKVAPGPDSTAMSQSQSDTLYPPNSRLMPTQFPHRSDGSSIRPSLSTTRSDASALSKHQPYQYNSSDLALDTYDTDDGTDKPIHLPPDPPKKTKDAASQSVWRQIFWPDSLACRAYILAVLVETFIDFGIESIILQQLNDMQNSIPPSKVGETANQRQRQPVYLGIFVLAHCVQMVLALDAVFNKNTLQFLFLAAFNFSLLVYGALQIDEVGNDVISLLENGADPASISIKALTWTVPIAIGIAEVVYVGLGYQIWREFGWKVYKFLGADRTIKKIYAQYQVFQCLLKFDIFFWVGFSIQWISLVLVKNQNSLFEFYATIVALPLSILLLIEGYLAARHENKWMMSSFMVGCVAGCAYFGYKAWRIFDQKDSADFEHLWKSLLIFALLAIALLLTTFVSATVVMVNFGGGLKESMSKKAKEVQLERRATMAPRKPTREGTLPPPALGYPPSSSLKRFSIE